MVDIRCEDIGDLPDRDKDDAVVLPLDQICRIFMVTLPMTVAYVITLCHGQILEIIKVFCLLFYYYKFYLILPAYQLLVANLVCHLLLCGC